jgi:hypothetical protein
MPAQIAETRIEADALLLEAAFEYDPSRGDLRVSYALRNRGSKPVAVFDRGDRQQVTSGRLVLGAVPTPRSESGDDGDIVLAHVARPLPQPPPVLPPTPLTARVEPGAALRGAFAYAPLAVAPRRLRWCLGVADFDASAFDQPQTLDGVSLWRASFAIIERQRRLCTPWFDPASGAFVG